METLQDLLDEAKIKGHFSIGRVHDFTVRCIRKPDCLDELEGDEDSTAPTWRDAYVLVNEVLSFPSSGSADHYHNYAVTFARESEFTVACDILLCGIKRYHANVDLLADFLEYAIQSSNDEHYKQCEEIFACLQSRRPQFWNWRAYDFSIDYLLDKLDRGIGDPGEIHAKCLELAKEFQKRISDNELGFIAEANVHAMFGEKTKQFQTLKKALTRTGLHAVQSAIALAEIYIKRNDPQEALKCVNRVLADLADINTRSTPARVYSLQIICKAALLLSSMGSNNNSEQIVNHELAQEILNDWNDIKRLGAGRGDQFYDSTKSLVSLVEVIGGTRSDEDL